MTAPWSMTAMSCASWSASSRYWLVSSTVVPSATISLIIAQTSFLLCGSSPVVGSSRYSTRGRPTSEAARSRRRRMPPEYVFAASSGRIRQLEPRQQLHRPGPRLAAAQAEQTADHDQVVGP